MRNRVYDFKFNQTDNINYCTVTDISDPNMSFEVNVFTSPDFLIFRHLGDAYTFNDHVCALDLNIIFELFPDLGSFIHRSVSPAIVVDGFEYSVETYPDVGFIGSLVIFNRTSPPLFYADSEIVVPTLNDLINIMSAFGINDDSLFEIVNYFADSNTINTIVTNYNLHNPDDIYSPSYSVDQLSNLINDSSDSLMIKYFVDNYNLANPNDIFQIASVLPSLNGNGSEHIDGTNVTVYGRDTEYTVKRSYMAIMDDNQYTIVYDLEATNGAKCTAPEALLTVVPVTAP